MDHYVKGESREVDETPPLGGAAADSNAVSMKVKDGTKIRNVMGYAIKKIKEPEVKQLTWNGSGSAVSKAISCAEIMKRKIKGLHQITKIYFKRVEDYWEPEMEGLDRLCVTRNVPAVVILLSKDPLDSSEPGYQPPGSFDAFWKKSIAEEQKSKVEQKKRNGGKGGAKRFSDDSSQFAPPSLARRPKKRRDGATPGSSGKGKAQEGRKLSGAEGKELKTAKNDNVKAQDRKKREKDSGADNSANNEDKMDTS